MTRPKASSRRRATSPLFIFNWQVAWSITEAPNLTCATSWQSIKRIDAKYAKVTGDNKTSSRPDYFTDEQLETLLKNWKQLEKPLQLDRMCRECGVYMRHSIMGSWHKTPDELVADEKKLTNQQKVRYRNLLRKKYFKRNDLPEVEKFYADGGGWDQLSEDGKEQIGLRTELGMAKPDQRAKYWKNRKGGTFLINILYEFQDKYVADKTGEVNSKDLKSMLIERLKLNEKNVDHSKFNWHQKDAIKYSHLIKFNFDTRFEFTKKKLPAEDAAMVRRVLLSMMDNLRIIAHSEMRAFRREKWTDKQVRGK